MLKNTTFTLIAISVLIAGNQSSAQAAKFKTFERQPAISSGKFCPRRMFEGAGVRDDKLQAMRSATSNWKANVRKSLSSEYANWTSAKTKHIRCSKDSIEQNYRCSAIAQACKSSIVGNRLPTNTNGKPRPTVTVKRR